MSLLRGQSNAVGGGDIPVFVDAATNAMLTKSASGALASGEAHIGEVGGNMLTISAEMTRPADTTAYTAGDVVSNNATTNTRAVSQYFQGG